MANNFSPEKTGGKVNIKLSAACKSRLLIIEIPVTILANLTIRSTGVLECWSVGQEKIKGSFLLIFFYSNIPSLHYSLDD
jgi:hypothetical protein